MCALIILHVNKGRGAPVIDLGVRVQCVFTRVCVCVCVGMRLLYATLIIYHIPLYFHAVSAAHIHTDTCVVNDT